MYPINPKYEAILGRRCYPSVAELPRGVDALAFCVSHARVLENIRLAAERRVGAAVIFDGGFAEAGDEGRRTQEEIAAICREASIALCGPNCMGVISPHVPSLVYLQALQDPAPLAGNVGLISQSGSVCIGLTTDCRRFGWSQVISSGNEAVLAATDFLEYLIDDPQTRVIAMFLETVRQPERFVAALDRAADHAKPVVVLKVGRSERTRRAITSHTGGLAGEARVFSAVLRAHRAIEVADLDEMTEVLACCQADRWPRGRRLAVMTAVGMSGAAVSSAMGRFKKGSTGALLALANVRLGMWMPNPRFLGVVPAGGLEGRRPGYPRRRINYLVKEVFGVYDLDDLYVYVTDGGHWENLGLVELLRRRCSEVFCFDASGSMPDSFGTLAEAITPNDNFYVVTKNAGGDPIVAPDSWRLVIEGEVNSPVQLDYATLRALPAVELTKTLECISNFTAECQLTAFGCELISTARWKGARLKDVLDLAGGLKPGVVVGRTDARAERPADRPLKPADLLATVYHQLGIDPNQTFKDHTGRPIPILDEGKPITELV